MHRLVIGFSAAALLTAGSALAAPASVRVEGSSPASQTLMAVNVQYGDLDISTNAGAQALLGRIKQAAMAVCGAKNGNPPPFVSHRAFNACYKQAVSYAVQSVHEPELTQIASAN